jgi:hypothetical protein
MEVPPFFPRSFATQGFRTEWLYFGSHGSGVPFHTDPQCHPKFSAHISGDKRWLLREEWRRPLGPAGAAAAEVEWVATVRQGDILIFYPQFHHSTLVLSEGGSLAYTGYIISPRDTPFIRDLVAASGASAPFAAAYRKCHAEGATLESMAKTCSDCGALPAGHPLRADFAATLTAMAVTLAGAQGADGFWRANILDAAAYPDPETTGTGAFTYAIAAGVRSGLLPRATYLPIVEAAWQGITSIAVKASGYVGHCQPVGGGPAPAPPTSTSDFCTGFVLLAGAEVFRLAKGV